MKIAHFSPLPPARTGVADYSATLLPFLARHGRVDLWINVSEENSTVPEGCTRVFYSDADDLKSLLSPYDAVVYHFGNSLAHRSLYRVFLENPGVVVLHDFVLHHFFAAFYLEYLHSPGSYVEEMEYNYGSKGRSLGEAVTDGTGQKLWDAAPSQYPLNKRILDNATAVIVHSNFVKSAVLATHPRLRLAKINHFARLTEDDTGTAELRRRYAIPVDSVVVGSFGFTTPAKRLDATLRVLKGLRRPDVLFIIVGEQINNIAKASQDVGMEKVRFTGYVDEEMFDDYIRLCDICVNLRSPTMGETSGSLCRALAAGKACVVSNVGWFSELPNNCVAKVDVDETEEQVLAAYLRRLIDDRSLRVAMGANSQRYVRENCDIEVIAQQYAGFLAEVSASRSQSQFFQREVAYVGRALARIGVTEGDTGIIEEVGRRLGRVLG